MTRRIRPKTDFALAQRVEQLWEKFDYPEIDANVPFDLAGGGGGMADYLIAKQDSTDEAQAAANYVMSLNEDLGDVIRGLTGVVNVFGTVWLASAQTSYQVSVAAGGIQDIGTLRGVGFASIKVSDDASGTAINVSKMYDVSVNGGTSSTNQIVANVGLLRNCAISTGSFSTGGIAAITANAIGCTFNDLVQIGSRSSMVVGCDWTDNFAKHMIESTPSGGTTGTVLIAGNRMSGFASPSQARIILDTCEDVVLTGNELASDGDEPLLHMIDCLRANISGNAIITPNNAHGLVIDGGQDIGILNNTLVRVEMNTDDTFDAIHLTGTLDRPVVMGNLIAGEGAMTDNNRAGVYVDSNVDCATVVGNAFSDTFGTAPIIDNGTDTRLDWPNDPTYGDNFTDCATSPSSPSSP